MYKKGMISTWNMAKYAASPVSWMCGKLCLRTKLANCCNSSTSLLFANISKLPNL